MKGTRLINRFSEKNPHLGKWTILGPKIHCKNFFKFCTMKRANRYMKVIMVCTKKFLFMTNGSF